MIHYHAPFVALSDERAAGGGMATRTAHARYCNGRLGEAQHRCAATYECLAG